MKKNIKYFIAGFLAASLLVAIPAAADFIDAFMNTARINIDGVDRISWGEEMELDNGWTAPTSINYKDTLYLPLRKISELSGKDVFWNGDSGTTYIVNRLTNRKVVAEREDAYGNLWEYATANTVDGHSYLTVTDGYRGYTRIYRTASSSVKITTEAIYFMRLKEHDAMQNQGTVIKLPFANDINSQDGEAVISLYPMNEGDVFFDGVYVFYAGKTPGNGSHGTLAAFNIATSEEIRFDGETWSNISNIKKLSGDNSHIVIEYTYIKDGVDYDMQISFDKAAKRFETPQLVPAPTKVPTPTPEPTAEPTPTPTPRPTPRPNSTQAITPPTPSPSPTPTHDPTKAITPTATPTATPKAK